jgi:class 3 adenylate cyclase/tetratricopeptide (TPR) repeat protein
MRSPLVMPLLTIVFTDVVGSSATKRDASLGRDSRERDHAYLEKVQTRHFELVRASCQAFGGKETSTMGDAFYLTFDDPVAAVRSAADIQKRLAENPIETPLGPLRLRIGIHSGFPEFFEGSWHGTDVDTAARVEATATERQILMSSRTYELVRHMTDVGFHPRGEFALKGVDRVALWEADWDGKGPRPTAVPPLGVIERKRTIRKSVVSLVALIVLAAAAGYIALRYLHPHKPPPFLAAARQSVAILEFKNLGNAQADWLQNALPEMLNTELSAGDRLRVISGEDVAKTTADLSLPAMPSYGKSSLEKLRGILKSDFVVAGSYVANGNDNSAPIRLDVHLQNASSGDIVSSFSEAGIIGSLPDMSKRIGAAVRAKLGIPGLSEDQSAAAQAALPSNPEATRLYTQGLAKLRTFDALGARDLLERAVGLEPKFAVAHAALANAWQILGYDVNAREEAKKAAELSTNLSQVDQRSIEGRYRELSAEWDKAIEIYSSLWGVFQDEPNFALELAKVQTNAGKGQDAMATLGQLQKVPKMGDDPRVDLARAFAAESLGDAKQQRSAAAAAADKATRLGSRYLAAQAHWLECSALYALGELDEGVVACQQAAAAAPFALQITARTQTVLANIMLAQGQTSEALEMRKQALDTARKIGSQKDVIGALVNLANLVDLQGNTKQARAYFDEAFKVAREINDKQQLLMLENDYAADLYGDGDFGRAEELYRKSLATAREIGERQGAAMALQNLSLLLAQRGQLAEAQTSIEQAIQIQQDAQLESDHVYSIQSLGDILLLRDDLAGAKKNYEEALKLANELHVPAQIALCNASLAYLALQQKRYADAESLARKAVDEFQAEKLVDQEADARNTLARALLAEGQIPQAQTEIDRALALSPQDRIVRMSLSITAARLKARGGDPAAAKHAFDTDLAEATKMGLVRWQFEIRLAREDAETPSAKAAGPRLDALENEARSKGYLLLASQAKEKRHDLSR